MVILFMSHVGGHGAIPGRVETLSSVSVNHSLTAPRYKNGTSECGRLGFDLQEDREVAECLSVNHGLTAPRCKMVPANLGGQVQICQPFRDVGRPYSNQGDGSHQGWVSFLLGWK